MPIYSNILGDVKYVSKQYNISATMIQTGDSGLQLDLGVRNIWQPQVEAMFNTMVLIQMPHLLRYIVHQNLIRVFSHFSKWASTLGAKHFLKRMAT